MTEEHRTLPAAEALLLDAKATLEWWTQGLAPSGDGLVIRNRTAAITTQIDAFLALPAADVGDEGLRAPEHCRCTWYVAYTRDSQETPVIGNVAPACPEHGRGDDMYDLNDLNARSAPASDAGLREALEKIANHHNSPAPGDGHCGCYEQLKGIARAALGDEQDAAGEGDR